MEHTPPLLDQGSSTPLSPPLVPLDASVAAAVVHAFGTASDRLLEWPQDIGGAWIERPELAQLRKRVSASEPTVTALLGEPGVGKSALLARLGQELRADGVALLALKADQLPREIASLAALDAEIGAPVPVSEALRRLAAGRRTVLLIDQLDALADLMDQHSSRLGILLRLVREVRDVRDLHVIVSCRLFEYRHDLRLGALRAEPVTLEAPPWEEVKPLLDARRIASDGWSAEVKSVLRIPQHLALFTEQLADREDPVFATYHAMLETVIDRLTQRYGARVVEAAERIAIAMAEEEELSLARIRFAAIDGDLKILERENVLVRAGARIAFRHQTVFDFLRSRAFLRDGTSLAAFVIERKQESLFVRPTLWSALIYLRANDPAAYKREFRRLWGHDGLRAHLRDLLAAFLGQVPDPDDEEARWLLPRLDNPLLRRRTLNSMAGRSGWFKRVKPRLPALMSGAPDTAWDTVWFLSRALPAARKDVIALIDRHWSHDPVFAEHAMRVLGDLTVWDESTVDVAVRIAGNAEVGPWRVRSLATRIGKSRPDLAPRVIARNLEARLDHALADNPPESGRNLHGAVERLLDSRSDLHDLDKVAMAAPRAFLEALWPWLLRVLDTLGEPPHPFVNGYRETHGLAFVDHDDRLHRPVHEALKAAAQGYAVAEPDAFLAFMDANRHHEWMVVHRLLVQGLTAIAAERPGAALAYILENPWRFAIGDFRDGHRDSKRLIAALTPALAPTDLRRLETAIMTWERYAPVIPDEDRETRFRRRKWTRQHRLRLLRAIPDHRLSERGRRHRDEEERALPNTPDYDAGNVDVYWVGSVVSAERMPHLSDDAIVALFDFLTDDVEDHPKKRWGPQSGGSRAASQAFEGFAKNHPQRAAGLLSRFQPARHERPTAMALRALASNEVFPPDTVIRLVHDLDARGFASAEFRDDAAHALATVAQRAKGLPDATLDLIESWVRDWQPPPSGEDQPDDVDNLSNRQADEEEVTHSFLWGHGGTMGLPHGNYPMLRAVTLGLLCRDPTDADAWLCRLERHLHRPEDPAVWTALSHYFEYLRQADRARTLAFLDRFLEAHPNLLASRDGVMLVAHFIGWLPSDRLDAILTGWIEGGWQRGSQAAGEIAALALWLDPDLADRRQRVEACIGSTGRVRPVATGLRLGIAHTMAKAWRKPAMRPVSTDVLLRIMPLAAAEPLLADVLHRLVDVAEPLPIDQDTRRILAAMARNPAVLTAGRHTFVGERLKDLLAAGFDDLDVLCAVTSILVEATERAIRAHSGAWPGNPGDLLDIALALQREPETRLRGIDLFERLIGIGEANERLRDLDRRAFDG